MNYTLHTRIMRGMLTVASAAIACSAGLFAQSSYLLSTEVDTYHPMTGGTPFEITFGDSITAVDLGTEPYALFRRSIPLTGDAALQIGGNGFLEVVVDNSVIIIDGLFTDLVPRASGSMIQYRLDSLRSGNTSEKLVTVEWKNAGFKAGTANDSANVQIRLFQRSGVIEIHYGPGAVASTSAFGEGPWAGAFTSPVDFSRMTEKCWIYGNPAAPAFDTSRTFEFRKLNALPPNGTVYRLTPRVKAAVAPSAPQGAAIELLPNPAHQSVEIALAGTTKYDRYAIVDARGVQVRSGAVDGTRQRVVVEDLPAGLYGVRLFGTSGSTTRMLIKQ